MPRIVEGFTLNDKSICTQAGLIKCPFNFIQRHGSITDQLQCYHRGASYPQGSTFPEGDGCNTCTCREGGYATCTDIGCQPSGPQYSCRHGTLNVMANETFLLETVFSCNNCTCHQGGFVTCEPIECAATKTNTTAQPTTKTNETTGNGNTTTVKTLEMGK